MTRAAADATRVESRWIVVDGLRLYMRLAGEPHAPPLVMVHGLAVSGRYFEPSMRLLARRFRVYAPDLPGFGLSDSPRGALDIPQLASALSDWMDACGIERTALLGHSMGCQIVACLAARQPGRVERAVLCGPTMDPQARNALTQCVRLLRGLPHERPSIVPLVLRDYLRTGLVRSALTFRHALCDRVEDNLPRMTMPTLILRGEHDAVIPLRWANEALSLLPQGRLLTLPGLAHAPHFADPPQFARAVEEFLSNGGWKP